MTCCTYNDMEVLWVVLLQIRSCPKDPAAPGRGDGFDILCYIIL